MRHERAAARMADDDDGLVFVQFLHPCHELAHGDADCGEDGRVVEEFFRLADVENHRRGLGFHLSHQLADADLGFFIELKGFGFRHVALLPVEGFKSAGASIALVMDFSTQFRRSVLYLVAGTRGGPMRLAVMRLVMRQPSNAHQVAKGLGIDYKTAVYHLEKLVKAGWLSRDAKRYGELYFSALSAEEARILEDVGRNPG